MQSVLNATENTGHMLAPVHPENPGFGIFGSQDRTPRSVDTDRLSPSSEVAKRDHAKILKKELKAQQTARETCEYVREFFVEARTPDEVATALKAYERLANPANPEQKPNPDACYDLGRIYQGGYSGIETDLPRALQYYRKSELLEAKQALIKFYEGTPIPKEHRKEALILLAWSTTPVAKEKRARILLESKEISRNERSDARALALFEEADTEFAQGVAAFLYATGRGTPVNNEKAVQKLGAFADPRTFPPTRFHAIAAVILRLRALSMTEVAQVDSKETLQRAMWHLKTEQTAPYLRQPLFAHTLRSLATGNIPYRATESKELARLSEIYPAAPHEHHERKWLLARIDQNPRSKTETTLPSSETVA